MVERLLVSKVSHSIPFGFQVQKAPVHQLKRETLSVEQEKFKSLEDSSL